VDHSGQLDDAKGIPFAGSFKRAAWDSSARHHGSWLEALKQLGDLPRTVRSNTAAIVGASRTHQVFIGLFKAKTGIA
jgi:hypothetical protein